MYCKNCGSQNADGVRFCRVCGAPMEQAAAPTNSAADSAANPGATYAPNPGYNPNPAYGSNPGYNLNPSYGSNPGYNTNSAYGAGYAPHYAAAPASGTAISPLRYIPIAGAVIAFIGVFLNWVTMSVYGVSDGVSMWKQLTEFFGAMDEMEGNHWAMMILSLLAIACTVPTAIFGFLSKKISTVFAVAGIASGVGFGIMYLDFSKDIISGAYGSNFLSYMDISLGIGFFIYVIGMAIATVGCVFAGKNR